MFAVTADVHFATVTTPRDLSECLRRGPRATRSNATEHRPGELFDRISEEALMTVSPGQQFNRQFSAGQRADRVRMAAASGISDRDLLDFADRWSRCGGGHPDAIWASFGLNEVEFFTRVLAITDSDDAESAVLRRVARRRLWLCR